MKITIDLTKDEMEHLESPHTFMDECEKACNVLYKVQKAIDKILKTKLYKCGRCGKIRKRKTEYVCKKCQADDKLTQWGRG